MHRFLIHAVRPAALLLLACLLAGLFAPRPALGETAVSPVNEISFSGDAGTAAADTDAPEEKRVLICLAEPMDVNLPYPTSGTEYKRDIAVPVLSKAHGFIYKKTTQVNQWLFPVSYAQGTPTLYLSLEGISDPISVSVNNVPLSADQPVSVPLMEMAELRVANAKSRGLIRLMFTNLPVVQVETDESIFKDRDTPCTVTVSDPDYHAHGLAEPVNTYDAVISRRGRSSSRYADKHPYNFSLMKDGRKLDQRLLGLRNDSDWLLDSAFNDRSRMRNRVLMDIWHEIYRLPWDQTLSGATRGVYVELFVGNAYRGLYVLGEKQDRRQLGLSKTGGRWNSSFFRTGDTGKDGSSPAGFVSLGKQKPMATDPQRWYNVWLRYPEGEGVTYAGQWADFYDYVRLVVRGTPEEFAERITQYADLDNLARYWLFANAADITDNMRKNMSFARLDDRDPRFNKYILVPWDMDSALGRYYSSKSSRVEELITNRLFDRLISENPHDFRATVYTLWQALKETSLSLDGIMAHFDHYYEIIHASGADRREIDKHPTFKSYVKAGYSFELNFEAEFKYIRKYTEKHLAWLDTKIEELCRPDP